MAPHSSSLAWKIPWMEEPGGLQSMGWLRVRHNWVTSLSFSLSCIGEGNGNPLQCSCLENPRDGGAWWAAVYGVARSWTQLKWLDLAAAAVAAMTCNVKYLFKCLLAICISSLVKCLLRFLEPDFDQVACFLKHYLCVLDSSSLLDVSLANIYS